MEVPKLSNDLKPLSNETFNLIFEEKECKLTISRTPILLKLILNQYDYTYAFEGNFTFEELIKINKIFGLFNTIEEIEKSLINAISSKKSELKKMKNTQINLIIKDKIFEKIIEINIP